MKRLYFYWILLFLLFFSSQAFADFRYKPALGGWFGVTQPMFETDDALNGYLGGGLMHRGTLPLQGLFYNLDASYLYFNSNVEKSMHVFPITVTSVYQLPINLPVKLTMKAGGGMSYVRIQPENIHGWDPTIHLGTEFFFPAGKIARIGFRVDFLWIMERHISSGERMVYNGTGYDKVVGATRDGYLLTMGLMVYFNFVK